MPLPSSESAALATALRRSVTQLARRMRVERPSDALPSARLSLLACLYRHGAMTAGELAAADSLQPQSVTRLLSALQEDELIAREVDESDRRRAKLVITDKGKAILRADARNRDDWLSEAVSTTLSVNEQRLLEKASALLMRLAESKG